MVYTESGALRPISKLILIVYGTFNLDFFRHALPPLCISTHLKPIHRNMLGYISAFHPLVLIFLTWFFIKLHNSNFKPVVILWRPFHSCFVQLRKGWNTKNDLIDVFASFFLLSYSKILYQTVIMVSTARNFHYSPTKGYLSETYVFDTDYALPINSTSFIVTSTFVGSISLVLACLPILLLTLYPLNCFKCALSKCKLDGIALTIFVERFHSCYRDGLDGGKDMRSLSGLYFLLRILIYGGLNNLGFGKWFTQGALFSITAVVIALCKPYKKLYMNISDALLLSHLALICHILASDTKFIMYFLPFMQTLLLIPFAVFAVCVLFRIVHGIYRCHFMKSLFRLCVKAESDTHIQQELSRSVMTYGAISS